MEPEVLEAEIRNQIQNAKEKSKSKVSLNLNANLLDIATALTNVLGHEPKGFFKSKGKFWNITLILD